MLPPSRITSIVHCIPVLVQEESALVHRQLIEDKLRVKRILALGGLSTHGVIVTRREGHGRRHAGLSHRRACYGNPARLGFDPTVVAKGETGDRPPTDEVLDAWCEACGLDRELFGRWAASARRTDGPIPSWLEGWLEAERAALVVPDPRE